MNAFVIGKISAACWTVVEMIGPSLDPTENPILSFHVSEAVAKTREKFLIKQQERERDRSALSLVTVA
jgi:hypothetical protein